jgi:hypothetical protein
MERAEQSIYRCYWLHHADGCKRKDCKFKHDKRIPKKELEELKARNLDQKRATSAPPAGKGEKGDSKGGGKKICYEFRKSGSCAKGDDCAYEHAVPADTKGPKVKPQAPQKAFGAPAISIFDLEDGHFCLAVGEENHKQVRFEKQKMTRGTRQKYQKDIVKVRVASELFNPQIARIHERIALLRARILKRNLQGHPDQNFIRQDWEGVDCQVYFNDPEENGSDAGKENLFEAEYEWIGEGGNRTHDVNDTKDLIISGPSFLSIAARNSNASGDSDSE